MNYQNELKLVELFEKLIFLLEKLVGKPEYKKEEK